jgi:hypothetical protein
MIGEVLAQNADKYWIMLTQNYKDDLKCLSSVSKKLRAIIEPILYKAIEVPVPEENGLEELALEPLLEAHQRRGILLHVRSIKLITRYNSKKKDLCVHNSPRRGQGRMRKLAGYILSQIRSCKDGTLRNFR